MIKINNENLRIRPSAVEGFYSCAYSWGKTFLEGTARPASNSRASIGTAIHAGVEAMWNDAITKGQADPNIGMMGDAAMEAWKEEMKNGMNYGKGEDENTCAVEIIKGTSAFVDDIVPFTPVPTAVEEFYTIPIKHVFVEELGGTIDYISDDTIADVKTSKRKSGPEGHRVQQSIYRMLANENGRDIKHNLIQQVVMNKNPVGNILQLEPDIDQAKYLVNGILDTLDLVAKDVAPIETILRPNPKHIFCSQKFCPHYNSCPAIKGNLRPTQSQVNIKL